MVCSSDIGNNLTKPFCVKRKLISKVSETSRENIVWSGVNKRSKRERKIITNKLKKANVDIQLFK